MAKHQIMKLSFKGQYKVIFDDEAKMNPYRIIKCEWDGKQKTVQTYADMTSVMCHLTEVVREIENGKPFMNLGKYMIRITKGFAEGRECIARKVIENGTTYYVCKPSTDFDVNYTVDYVDVLYKIV